jgi:hypothetical protein
MNIFFYEERFCYLRSTIRVAQGMCKKREIVAYIVVFLNKVSG